MTVQEILKKIRVRLFDDVGDKHQYWKDSELVEDYLEEARTDLFRIVRGFLIDSSTPTDAQQLPLARINVVAGTGLYAVSPKIIETTRLQLASMTAPIQGMTMEQLDKLVYNWQGLNQNLPFAYCTDYATDSILFVPVPLNNDTANLTNRIYPLGKLSSDIPGMSLGFREEYHKDLIPAVLAKAYAKNDSETYRADLIAKYEAQFEKRADEIKIEMYRRSNGPHSNRCNRAYTSK